VSKWKNEEFERQKLLNNIKCYREIEEKDHLKKMNETLGRPFLLENSNFFNLTMNNFTNTNCNPILGRYTNSKISQGASMFNRNKTGQKTSRSGS